MNYCNKCGNQTTRKELFSSFYEHCDICDAPKRAAKPDAVGDVLNIQDESILTLPPGMKFDDIHHFNSRCVPIPTPPQFGTSVTKVNGWSTRKDVMVYNGTKEIMSVAPGARGAWKENLTDGDVIQINAHSWTCLVAGIHFMEFDGTILTITRDSDGCRWFMDPNKGLIGGSAIGRFSHSAPQVQSIQKPTRVAFAVSVSPCHVDPKDSTTMIHCFNPNSGPGKCACGQTQGSMKISHGAPTPASSNLKDLKDRLHDAQQKLNDLKKPVNRVITHAIPYKYGSYWRDGDRCFINVTHVGDMKDVLPPGLEAEGGLKLEVLGIHDEPTLFSFKVKGWVENV